MGTDGRGSIGEEDENKQQERNESYGNKGMTKMTRTAIRPQHASTWHGWPCRSGRRGRGWGSGQPRQRPRYDRVFKKDVPCRER